MLMGSYDTAVIDYAFVFAGFNLIRTKAHIFMMHNA